jgi:hypothetical protein
MKLKTLFENDRDVEWENRWKHLPDGVYEWLFEHSSDAIYISTPEDFSFKNGELNLNEKSRIVLENVSDSNLPNWKWGEVGEIEFHQNCTFTDITFVPRIVHRNLHFRCPISMKGIHKRVETCYIIYLSRNLTSGILDVARIKDIRGGILMSKNTDASAVNDLVKAFQIIKFGFEDGEDVFDMQSELMDEGLEKFI